MQFQIYDLTVDRYLNPVHSQSDEKLCLNQTENQWVNLTGYSRHELKTLLQPLGLLQEIFEASIVPQTRPQVLLSDRALFVSIPFQITGEKLSYCSFLCLSTILVTMQPPESLPVEKLASRYQRNHRLSSADTTGMVLELLDKMACKTSSTLFSLRNEVERMSLTLEVNSRVVGSEEIVHLGRKAVLIESLFQDQQYCMQKMLSERSDNRALTEFQSRLSLIVDGLDRGLSAIIQLQDRIRGLHEYHPQRDLPGNGTDYLLSLAKLFR